MTDSVLPPAGKPGKRYSQLKAWMACHDLFLRVHQVTRSWPTHELHGLGSQAARAAFSAAANIAEGVSKSTAREFRRFLDVSIGSLGELSYVLLAARDIGLLSPSEYGELEALRDHANRLTWGLYRAVRAHAAKR
jgi:four helix bundle protein